MSEDAQDVVLIVEDDESIMFVLGEYLSGLGYRVLKAIDGEQAFEILATKPHLDLMVTDYRLPGGISGVQIAEPAIKLRPELKVIFISGYPQEILDCSACWHEGSGAKLNDQAFRLFKLVLSVLAGV